MTLEQNISDEMLKGNYYLVGSFSAYSQIFTEYADAEFCIFSYDQL
ncbi:MAG: hypothetical protein MJ195_02870 [Mycoplasmoidaceae bacterium]|nr:hypothetical protein [Mycoplasmoidaceae bacterium]